MPPGVYERSAAAIAANSRGHVGVRPSQATRDKLSASTKRHGVATGWKQQLSLLAKYRCNRGVEWSAERRAAFSKSQLGRRAYHVRPVEYNGIKFASSWEVAVAKQLDARGIQWLYEPKSFTLSDGSRYTPDFYVPSDGAYWEVKGWFNARSRWKVNDFRRQHPEIPLVVVDAAVLLMLGVDVRAKRRLVA